MWCIKINHLVQNILWGYTRARQYHGYVFSYILFICSLFMHAHMGNKKNACKVSMGKLKDGGHLEDLSTDGE